jgi:NAD(P)-dependent dehydrogenase (short-subunit alcohol dehydrogenase family)
MAKEINFAGKKVLVTGGGSGIGKALCKTLHSQGAQVFALCKNQDWLSSLQNECPGVKTVCVDLEDWDATRAAVSALEVLDCLVNNAGIAAGRTVMQTTPENFDKLMNVNVKAIINVSQVVAQKMMDNNRGGSIVNVSSIASRFGVPQSVSYNVTKASVDLLTKAMAVELGPKNIRVNAINPTIIMTPLVKHFYEKGAGVQLKQMVTARTPMGRIAELDEVVNTILFLLSDLAPMIHGENIFIDGGYSGN